MKKYTLILAMLLMATTAFNQTSRRTANTNTQFARKMEAKKGNGQRKNTSNSVSTRTRTRTTYTVTPKQTENRPAVSSRRNYTQRPTSMNKTRQPRNNNNNITSNSRDNYYVSEYGRRMNNNQQKFNNNNRIVRSSNNTTRTITYNNRSTTKYYPSQRKFYGHHEIRHHYTVPPKSRIYRASHYPYRSPVYVNIVWTERMRNFYVRMYPKAVWHYHIGYRIESISAYDALYYTGDIKNVYGKVYETYYSGQTDEYYLYFGAYYPYHDFTVVIPGKIARRFSRRPDLFFENQYVMVNGLITSYENKPEMVIHRDFQIKLY